MGNSYTYVNDVPKTTQGLTYHDGIAHHMEYDQHTEGGWTWEDHANSQVSSFSLMRRGKIMLLVIYNVEILTC